jgi:hypothetical protein
MGIYQQTAFDHYKDMRSSYRTLWETASGKESGTGYPQTLKKASKTRTIAGVVCDEYTIETTITPLDYTYVSVKAWYDPQTWVIMRYEKYDYDNFEGTIRMDYRLTYWFEVESVEYGKVKQSDIDAILNEWLKTHTPKDTSEDYY